MNDMDAFQQALDGGTPFHLRRAVERMREGLFDPVAVRLLTAHETQLNAALDVGFGALDAGRAPHLCVVGAYGQGKSHSLTYIQDRALREGYAVSMINLDPREVPFYNFRQVYRALMAALRFPGTEASLTAQWRAWAERRLQERAGLTDGIADLIPEGTPHPFRAVLAAIPCPTLPLTPRQRRSKQHARRYFPRSFPYWLSYALMGETIPAFRLRSALKYRRVPFYRDASLVIRGDAPYLQMLRSLAALFRRMGYRGWVTLFDEGESITQVRVTLRARSYAALQKLLAPEAPGAGLYPVFAFTDDFFQRVQDEDYERSRLRYGQETPYFDRNYAEAWQHLTRYHLQDLSSSEWMTLAERLMRLHARAYEWRPPETRMREEMAARLAELEGHETRFRLKGLVDHLDVTHQAQVLKPA